MRIRDKRRRLFDGFANDLDEIKATRIKSGVDKKWIGDRRLTRGIKMNPETSGLWNEIKFKLGKMPRIEDVDKRKGMNKYGSILDPITLGVLIILVVVFLAGLVWVFGMLTDTMTSLDLDIPNVNSTQAAEDTFGVLNESTQDLRIVAAAIIFGVFLTVFLGNFLIKAHPAWLLAYILVIILAVILSVFISNAYETLASQRVLDGTLETFTIGNWMLLNLPAIVAVVGTFGAIFLFIGILRDDSLGGSPL